MNRSVYSRDLRLEQWRGQAPRALPQVDLAARVYPAEPVVPAGAALRIRNERRLRALGIARARGPECAVEPADVGG